MATHRTDRNAAAFLRRFGPWFVYAVIALAIVAGLIYRYAPHSRTQVPDVSVTTTQGAELALASFRGKVVLVNFWATTCAVCLREMPRLSDLYRRHRDQGYEMVAVAMPYDPPNRVLDYARRNALPFTVGFDFAGKAVQAFGDVDATPTTFLIDRNGMIVRKFVGAPDFAELEKLIEGALAAG